MDHQFSTLLVESLKEVLSSFSGRQVLNTNLDALPQEGASGDIAVCVGIIGALDGKVCLWMDEKSGIALASEMLGGMDLEPNDELVLSAVSELCNMVMGGVCSGISSENAPVDILPPEPVWDRRLFYQNAQPNCNIAVGLESLGPIRLDAILTASRIYTPNN